MLFAYDAAGPCGGIGPGRDPVRVKLSEVVSEARSGLAEPGAGLIDVQSGCLEELRNGAGAWVEVGEAQCLDGVAGLGHAVGDLAHYRSGDRQPANVECGLAEVVVDVFQPRGSHYAVVERIHGGGVAERVGARADEEIVEVVGERRLVAEGIDVALGQVEVQRCVGFELRDT